jgi:hypothetical protein
MLLFLALATVGLPLLRLRADGWLRAAIVPVLFVVCWLGAIAPFTYRNYVMTGRPILVTEGQARTFIEYNLPPSPPADPVKNEKYLQDFRDSNFSAVVILLRILWDQPMVTLGNWGTKAGFGWAWSTGWERHTASRARHDRPAVSSRLIFLRDARRPAAWVVHGFVFTHLATLCCRCHRTTVID